MPNCLPYIAMLVTLLMCMCLHIWLSMYICKCLCMSQHCVRAGVSVGAVGEILKDNKQVN